MTIQIKSMCEKCNGKGWILKSQQVEVDVWDISQEMCPKCGGYGYYIEDIKIDKEKKLK